jgi:diguanylate cyclase (GGDEF)-like protein/PAS domain S-box-containing protein
MLETPKILVVDDNRRNLVAMRRLLGKLSCDILEATTGNEALASCLNYEFALVLLDVDIPGMDGFEVARLLKDEPATQQLPLIFVTATYEDHQHRLRGYEAGAVDYIHKPVDDVILLSKANIFIDLFKHRQVARRELSRSEALRSVATENEARFRQALVEAPVAIMLSTEDGEVVLLNRMWTQVTGYARDDIPTMQDWLRKAYGEGGVQERLVALDEQFTLDGWRSLGESSVLTASGARRTWDVRRGRLAPLVDGRRLMMTMAVDVTERRLAEDEMRLSSLVFQNSSEGMTVTDADGTIISVNPAFTALTGYSLSEVIGQNPRLLKSGRHDEAFYRTMWSQLETTGRWQGEIWNKRKNGEVYAERLTINTIFDAGGKPHRHVALFSDITEKKHSEELIWRQANFDSLTGLPNRRMFHDRLDQELKKARRSFVPLALMFLDLDEFKGINDTLGHDMGDELLKEVTRRLHVCVREADTVARLGGDEFTVILTNLTDAHGVERVAKGILRELAEPFNLGGTTIRITASIGITVYPDDGTTFDELMKNADQAMYAAKNQGRNRYHYFTPVMQEAAYQRMHLGNDLRVALHGNQFQLYYQPIIDLSTGQIRKAEALIRWQHPERGLVSPAAFIPIAEETGAIFEIGNWVFREAAAQVDRWRAAYAPDFQVSINKSPAQFNGGDTCQDAWLLHLRDRKLPGNSIVVEITEGLLLDASVDTKNKLLGFRDAGIQVAIDDFGTGYSSLAYLQKLDIDYLKIDQAFVRDLAPQSKNVALCTAIVAMAHALGLKVIAEGVETKEQKELLIAAGCDYGQGYYFCRPEPADVFEHMLKTSFREPAAP